MSRIRLFDHLQNFKFHLFDVSWSLSFPPFALTPIYGFQSITSPEIRIETEEYAEGNDWFKRHLIVGGSVPEITMQQGVSVFNSDFWNWTVASLRGAPSSTIGIDGKRRNFLLVQYTGYSAEGAAGNQAIPTAMSGALGFLPTPNAIFSLPGKAWMLNECIPTNFKAASDFDATSGDISLASITVAPHSIDEIAVSA
jgi:phage tail-like protein